jgi:hypothetical protein
MFTPPLLGNEPAFILLGLTEKSTLEHPYLDFPKDFRKASCLSWSPSNFAISGISRGFFSNVQCSYLPKNKKPSCLIPGNPAVFYFSILKTRGFPPCIPASWLFSSNYTYSMKYEAMSR